MLMSHALRVRGLKLEPLTRNWNNPPVARSTRAWIETIIGDETEVRISPSHALRVRGLKLLTGLYNRRK